MQCCYKRIRIQGFSVSFGSPGPRSLSPLFTSSPKKDYEKQSIQNMKPKPKDFWQYVNSKVKTRPKLTELLRSDGTAASSDTEMATMLND